MRNGRKTVSNGFTLLEVLIALTIFAAFMASFVISQGYSLNFSSRMKEDLKLKELCQKKINEIVLLPPLYTERLTLSNEVATFENEVNYEFEIEYRRLVIPDPSRLAGEEQGDDGENRGNIQRQVTTKVIDLMKKLIWQVDVTIRNKKTKRAFNASTWLLNDKANINVSL